MPVCSTSQLTGNDPPAPAGHRLSRSGFINGHWHGVGNAACVDDGTFTVHRSRPARSATETYRVVRRHRRAATRTRRPAASAPSRSSHRRCRSATRARTSRAAEAAAQAALRRRAASTAATAGTPLHAVTAFEKVQGLTTNGDMPTEGVEGARPPEADPPAAPGSSRQSRSRSTSSKQVLLIAQERPPLANPRHVDRRRLPLHRLRGGTVARDHADRPLHVQYKLDRHLVYAKLGTLYYPSYFTDDRLRDPRRGQRQRRRQRAAVSRTATAASGSPTTRSCATTQRLPRGRHVGLDLPLIATGVVTTAQPARRAARDAAARRPRGPRGARGRRGPGGGCGPVPVLPRGAGPRWPTGAYAAGAVIESYAYARIGYHRWPRRAAPRGLEGLRRRSRGRTSRTRASCARVYALGRAADAIGENDEAAALPAAPATTATRPRTPPSPDPHGGKAGLARG